MQTVFLKSGLDAKAVQQQLVEFDALHPDEALKLPGITVVKPLLKIAFEFLAFHVGTQITAGTASP